MYDVGGIAGGYNLVLASKEQILIMNLEHVSERLSVRDFYGKIIKGLEENEYSSVIRFTSIPPEVDAYFQAHLQHPIERGERQKRHPISGRESVIKAQN